MRKVIFSLVAIVCILGAMATMRRLTFGYAPWLDTLVSYITYPVVITDYLITRPLSSVHALLRDRFSAEMELHNLEEERQELLARIVELESCISTQKELEEMCAFKKRYTNTQALAAQIISTQSTPYEQTALVDIGSSHGVVPDMVAVYKNCIVGRVSEVYPHMSHIILITDPRCKIAAYCVKTNARGIHEGCNTTDQTTLSFVSHLQQLQEGDLVLSSGEGLVFPRGFGIGHITAYTLNGLNYSVAVTPLILPKTMRYCLLIQKGAEYQEEESPQPEKSKTTAHPVRIARKAPEPEIPHSDPTPHPEPEVLTPLPPEAPKTEEEPSCPTP